MPAARPKRRDQDLAPIDPQQLYPLAAFYKASGISQTRVSLAARDGVRLPIVRVGRRGFVRGADAIRYIEELAELTAQKRKARQGRR